MVQKGKILNDKVIERIEETEKLNNLLKAALRHRICPRCGEKLIWKSEQIDLWLDSIIRYKGLECTRCDFRCGEEIREKAYDPNAILIDTLLDKEDV